MSLEPWKENSYLVRFEHLLEKNEDSNQYSKSVTFHLKDVFGTLFDIDSVRETNLAANQWLSDVKQFKFRKDPKDISQRQTEDNELEHDNLKDVQDDDDDDGFTVTLAPMQIRTYIITVNEQL